MDTIFRAHHDGLAVLAGTRPDDRRRSAEAARSHERVAMASALRAGRRPDRAGIPSGPRRWLLAGLLAIGGRRATGALTR